jgi:hypothetical protein
MPHDRSNDPLAPRAGSSPGPPGRPRRRTIAVAGALALAVALASVLSACGSDDDDTAAGEGAPDLGGETTAPPPPSADEMASTGPDDPCVLLEEAELEAQFGPSVPPGTGGRSYCEWLFEDIESGAKAKIDLTIIERPQGMSTDDRWAELLAYQREHYDPAMLTGIGDDAYVVDNNPGRALTFRSGDAIVELSAGFYKAPPGTDEKLTALAQLVIGRL